MNTASIELSVLGAMFDPSMAYDVFCTATEEHFGEKPHRQMYLAAMGLNKKGYPVTPEAVAVALQVDHEFEEDKAWEWVSTVTQKAPPESRNLRYILDGLGKARINALTADLGQALIRGSSEPLERTLAKIAAFQRSLTSLDENRARTYEQAFRELATATDRVPYLTPGMGLLDRAVKFYPGSVNFIGANSGGGKTSWLLNALWNMAAAGHHVGIISIEMTRPQIASRLSGLLSGLNTMRVKDHDLQEGERRIMMESVDHRQGTISRLHGIEPAQYAADLVKPTIDRWINEFDIKAVGVDYVQRMKADHKSIRNETDRVSYVSSALTEAAKSTNIPIIALSQLRRREGEGAAMNDFKHSGQLEHDGQFMATIIPVDGQLPGSDTRRVWFKVVKQRDGVHIEDQLDYHLPTQVFRHNGVMNDGFAPPSEKKGKPTPF